MSDGKWEPGASVTFDEAPAFAFAAYSGKWTRAGELVFPHWVLLILCLVPFILPAVRFLKRPNSTIEKGVDDGSDIKTEQI